MTLKSDPKVKEKLTCGFKYDTRNLVNFYTTTQKSEKFASIGSFCPKDIRFELKSYRGVILHYTENWCKIWINSALWFQKRHEKLGGLSLTTLKSLKKCTMMGSFGPKHIMFQQENFKGIMCSETKKWWLFGNLLSFLHHFLLHQPQIQNTKLYANNN